MALFKTQNKSKQSGLAVASSIFISSLLFSSPAQAVSYYKCTSTSGCDRVNKFNFQELTYSSDYTKTKYPVVLQHGMYGSTENTIPSFYGIQEDLAINGSEIYLTETTAFENPEVRGEMLLKQLENIQAVSPYKKFNLVGHSHGGFDIRYVAGIKPEIVASVTGVGTPSKGSEVAEFINAIKNGLKKIDANEGIANAISKVVNFLGNISDVTNVNDNHKQDSLAGLASLTYAGANAFNKKFPIAIEKTCDSNTSQADFENGVAYYSWSGTSQFTNPFDPIDYGFSILNVVFGGKPNDGLVSRCSSHVGYVIRDNYKMNHLDELNQMFGMVNWFEANPKSVHRNQINRLKNRGF